MRKKSIATIAIFLILFCFSLNAQMTSVLKCKMTVEEIMSIQSFSIDIPEYNKANAIAESLISSFELFYGSIYEGNTEDTKEQKERILAAINSAEIIKMDYSMFKEDIDFLNNYDLK